MTAELLALLALLVLVAGTLQMADLLDSGRNWETYRLRFPADLRSDAVMGALASLAAAPVRPVVLELVATAGGLEHRLRLHRQQAAAVTRQLRATLPGLRLEHLDAAALQTLTYACAVRLTRTELPLRTEGSEAVAAALLAAFQPLAEGEALVLQHRLQPLAPRALDRAGQPESVRFRLGRQASLRLRPTRELQRARATKAALPWYAASIRLGATAADRQQARRLVARPWSVLASLRNPFTSLRLRALPHHLVAWSLTDALRDIGPVAVVANTAELLALVAWPIGSPQVPGLTLGTARLLAPTPGIPTTGRIIGRASGDDERRAVAVRPDDALRHSYLVGPTGAGKSTLLLNLIASDLATGHGVVVFDPKGDLVADVLDRVPARRVKDVILLDPTDSARPVGLNVLAGAAINPELAVDQVTGIFARLYASSWGPRTEDVLRAGLLTLSATPGLTLCDLPRLLHDSGFRASLVARLDDPLALEPFWTWYESLREGERAQIIAPLMNKLRAVLLRSAIRSIVGQAESTFDLAGVLAERRVLLVNLPKGELGEDAARLLGSLVFARLWQAVQGRSALPPDQRPAVFAYLDEFQDFLNLPTALADVLAQARGLGFGLTLAHQHTHQLPADVREAVLANCRTKVFFQTSASDATRLARELAPHVAPTDLQHLPAHEVYVAPCVDGQTRPPLSVITLPAPSVVGYGAAVRQRSRQWYGRDREAVEREMRDRQTAAAPTGSVGRKRRQG